MIVGYTQTKTNENIYRRQIHESLKLSADCVYVQKSLNRIKNIEWQPQDILIVSDISCLGKNLNEVRANLEFFFERQVRILSLAEKYEFLAGETGRYLLKIMDMVINIRKNLASKSTVAALKKKKEEGFKLGRAKGIKLKKLLDGKESVICKMLADGIAKTKIAQELGVSRVTLYHFIEERSLTNTNGA